MALRSHQALLCMAGITFSIPIRAVLSTPQTTFFMWHPRMAVHPILAARGGCGKCSRRGRAARVCYIPPRTERRGEARAGESKRTGGCGPDPEFDWGSDMASEKE